MQTRLAVSIKLDSHWRETKRVRDCLADAAALVKLPAAVAIHPDERILSDLLSVLIAQV